MKITSKFLLGTIIIFAAVSCNTSNSSSSDAPSSESNTDLYKRLYDQSRELGDMQTAATALQMLLLHDTANMEYMDSLSRIYLNGGMIEPGLALGEKVIKRNPENYGLLALVAAGRAYNGQLDEAMNAYELLHEEEKLYIHLYQMATIEANRQNLSNAIKQLNTIVKDRESVEMMDVRTADGGTQKVRVRAAAYFLKAQIAGAQNDVNSVQNYISRALEISPDYQEAMVAQQQLSAMQQQARAQGQQPNQRRNLSKIERDRLEFERFKQQNQ
jgi:tetratricopeptide (TPR) repeat protein